MKGTFYGVGVGPGDPELLSLKAVKIIKQCPVIAYPKSLAEETSTAYQIAKPYLEQVIKELPVSFKMERDMHKRKESRQIAADRIAKELDQGRDVAFLTLGDSTLYSTCMYLSAILEEMEYPCEIIPGIPAICAMAAKLHKPLAEGDEAFVILPVSKDTEKLRQAVCQTENIALMKVSKKREEIQRVLEEQAGSLSVVGISDCGMEGERQYHCLAELMEEERVSYFTSLLLKKIKKQD